MRRKKGSSLLSILLWLIAGMILMSSEVSRYVQSASAQETGADQLAASRGLALAPNAPHWADKASSNVRLRFTNRWQQLKAGAARTGGLPAPASDLSIEAAVTFGSKVFNKESASGLPQNETTIAIDPLNTSRFVGGYNDYRGLLSPYNFTGWSTTTDDLTTIAKDGQIPPAVVLGQALPSGGDPAADVDSSGNFFMGTFWFDDMDPNGVGIARSPAAGSATGVFSAACTGGGDTDCWPVRRVVAENTCSSTGGYFHDKPYIAVDRSSSAASGSVYIVWTRFGCAFSDFSSRIMIAKCTNSLAVCTAPVVLEYTPGTGSYFDFVQLSHLAVGPTGKVYVVWNRHSGSAYATELSYVRLRVITPTSSTSSVGTVGPFRTVHAETSPIPWGLAPYPAYYRTSTYPHVAVKGNRAIIVWDRRTVPDIVWDSWYFGSDIVGKYTDDDGATFSAIQTVSSAFGHQYQPSICVDNTTGTVVVAYFSHQNDLWSHKQDVYVASSATGAAPFTPLRVTSLSNDTEADPWLSDMFIGDYIEVACRGGKGVVHYTANYRALPFPYGGGSSSLFVRQQDNFVGSVTLP